MQFAFDLPEAPKTRDEIRLNAVEALHRATAIYTTTASSTSCSTGSDGPMPRVAHRPVRRRRSLPAPGASAHRHAAQRPGEPGAGPRMGNPPGGRRRRPPADRRAATPARLECGPGRGRGPVGPARGRFPDRGANDGAVPLHRRQPALSALRAPAGVVQGDLSRERCPNSHAGTCCTAFSTAASTSWARTGSSGS